MKKQDVLKSIENFSEDFPKEALKEVRNNRADYLPELLESLDYVYQNAEALHKKRSNYNLHIYAMYLLAEFREKKAFPYLIALLLLPEDLSDYILGDFLLTGDFGRLLLCTYDDGKLQMLCNIIENQELFEWARLAAIRAYGFLCNEGLVYREEAVSYLRSLIHKKLPPTDSQIVLTALVGCVIDCKLYEMIPDIHFLYDNNSVDTDVYGRYDGFIDSLFNESPWDQQPYIDDALKKMEGWACFNESGFNESGPVEKSVEDEEKAIENKEKAIEDLRDLISEEARKDREKEQIYAAQAAQKHVKLGRNEPCHCGSGKKYKKCCYESDQTNRITNPANVAAPVVRLEDKYNLLEWYPKDSSKFKAMFEEEAIKIDTLVYKALSHKTIPIWVNRDYEQERIGKIYYMAEALDLFLDKCSREQITSFSDYDDQYMIHYRSSEWVFELIDLIERHDSPKIKAIKDKATDTLRKFE